MIKKDAPTNQHTVMRVHGEVTLSIIFLHINLWLKFAFFSEFTACSIIISSSVIYFLSIIFFFAVVCWLWDDKELIIWVTNWGSLQSTITTIHSYIYNYISFLPTYLSIYLSISIYLSREKNWMLKCWIS